MAECRFAVRVKPGAAKERVGGCWLGPHGKALVVAVTAPAVEGKANEAVRKALARAFGLRRTDISIAVGAHGRDKIVAVDIAATDLPALTERVAEYRDEQTMR
jgi:uncharacterized protein